MCDEDIKVETSEAQCQQAGSQVPADGTSQPCNKADIPQLFPYRPLKVGEMFCGPGGIGIALNNTKSPDNTESKYSFEHSWSTDWDKDTCETYKKNVLRNSPNAKVIDNIDDLKSNDMPVVIHKDVRDLEIDKLPVVDGFLYGFPCNDFSLVGKTKGLNGNYGGLFSYGVKYIARANPLFFFAENVSGLASANDGKAFEVIMKALNNAGEYGYTITAHLYKFEEYGVPQTRHRYILIGIRGDLRKANGSQLVFKVPKPSGKIMTCEEALKDIPKNASNHEPTRMSKTVEKRLELINEGENIWQAEERLKDNFPQELRLNVKGARMSQIYRRLDSKKPAYTITGSGGGGTHVYHWAKNECRALTNRERARLQTFPDNFEFIGNKESVRKQVGMAVPCKGAEKILKALLQTLAGEEYPSVEPSNGYYKAKEFPNRYDPEKDKS